MANPFRAIKNRPLHQIERGPNDRVVTCMTCRQQIKIPPGHDHDSIQWKVAVQRFINAHS